MFDINGDRKVSYREIIQMFKGLKEIDEEAIERATETINTKDSKNLTFTEFVDLM
jgi:hypothetical protein